MTPSAATDVRRLILITGVGKPGQVGEAVAGAMAADGDVVLLVDRGGDQSEARAAEIRRNGGQAYAFGADLSSATDVDRLAAEVRSRHGDRLHAVVHMAGGWQPGGAIAEVAPAHWERMITINLLTAAHTARAFVPFIRGTAGAFVFFASEAALPGARIGGMAAYAAAKQGVVALARALAQEERANGVRSNALAPASIRTASNEAGMGVDADYVEREEVADAVRWLCSPAASAVSGEVIRLAATRRRKAE